MKKHTCFVVSPIGAKDSPTRLLADDLYELLIEPALEKFNFQITRADKISSVTSITSDIIEHLQNADICIIDITGHNPNVMYECGRRHETGKPYIMVAREGETLPFDITTIRTFFYNLSKPRDILATKNAIQDTLEKVIQDGFQSDASGDSLASVVEILRRIERKIDASPSTFAANAGGAAAEVTATATELVKRLGVVDAFVYARSQEDPDLIDAVMPHLRKKFRGDKKNLVKAGIASGASYGSRVAFEELETLLPLGPEYSDDERLEVLAKYVTGAYKLGESQRALKYMQSQYGDLTSASPPPEWTPEQRANLLNQYQRVLYTLGSIDDATAVAARVLELFPNKPSYLYNLALNYEMQGDIIKAVDIIDRLMAISYAEPNLADVDLDHLKLAVSIYAKSKQAEKLREAFQMIKRIDPIVAQVVSEDEDIQAVLKKA